MGSRHTAPDACGSTRQPEYPSIVRRLASLLLVATLLAGLGVVAPAGAAPALAATANPKVAIIVGATHGTTSRYRSNAQELAAVARQYTSNVVTVYSPSATWTKVKAAVNGASVIVYLGHGNGWPSPYTFDPNYTTKDGFGLNADVNGDGRLSDYEVKYYGEPSVRTLTPAPNAVVLLFHLCYASGNAESGAYEPSLSVARQRVDNYGAGFLRTNVRAVIADGHSDGSYYMDALFTSRQSILDLWRNAPDYNGNEAQYASARTPGATYAMDPESPGYYYRSIVGKLTVQTQDITGAEYADTTRDPATMQVPGNASPAADAAPVYASTDDLLGALEPATTLGIDTRVRVDWAEAGLVAPDGSPVYRIHTDEGVEGWMAGSSLLPRDGTAPRVWTRDDGSGAFSPNGDGSGDTYNLAVQLSEASSWTLTIRQGWHEQATFSGEGDLAQIAWTPTPGTVGDGWLSWRLTATDAWGNGPTETEGWFEADTSAPTATVTTAAPVSAPVLTPNGDTSGESTSWAITSSEDGTAQAIVRNVDGDVVRTVDGILAPGGVRLAWNGRDADGAPVPDGAYTVDLVTIDPAGNPSEPVTRDVAVYTGLGFLGASSAVFLPQDGDALAATTDLSFTLSAPATVDWTVVNAAGAVVRTIATGEAREAGVATFTWDGRDDAGAMVPRGTYRSVVKATDGTLISTQALAITADAFRIAVSDTTPARRQRITVSVVSAEGLSAAPRLRIAQPGIAAWTVTMTRTATGSWKAVITLKSSNAGTLRLRVSGVDTNGAAQLTEIVLPLH